MYKLSHNYSELNKDYISIIEKRKKNYQYQLSQYFTYQNKKISQFKKINKV